MSAEPRSKLSEDEMMSQMSLLTLAGHETTANTVTWLLYELAKQPKFQEMLRAEIAEKRSEIIARGDQEFTMEDLESMKFMQATIVVSPPLFGPIQRRFIEGL